MNPNRAPKLSDDELTALLSAERQDALAAVQATKLSEDRERALEYYVGDVTMEKPNLVIHEGGIFEGNIDMNAGKKKDARDLPHKEGDVELIRKHSSTN